MQFVRVRGKRLELLHQAWVVLATLGGKRWVATGSEFVHPSKSRRFGSMWVTYKVCSGDVSDHEFDLCVAALSEAFGRKDGKVPSVLTVETA
jgi:hypothetical protein